MPVGQAQCNAVDGCALRLVSHRHAHHCTLCLHRADEITVDLEKKINKSIIDWFFAIIKLIFIFFFRFLRCKHQDIILINRFSPTVYISTLEPLPWCATTTISPLVLLQQIEVIAEPLATFSDFTKLSLNLEFSPFHFKFNLRAFNSILNIKT